MGEMSFKTSHRKLLKILTVSNAVD